MYNKGQAIEIMNQWGARQIPFLFIIDFEMRKIRLYRTDISLPNGIMFSIAQNYQPNHTTSKRNDFVFMKKPVPFHIYENAFLNVMDQILTGNSYLLNLTFPTHLSTNLSMQEIYNLSHAKYKLLINGEFVVFSPETFITIKNGQISSFPMKGTIKASLPGAEEEILQNIKETAEHHTIVDLIRNDLSKVAANVSVKRFRYLDKISTNQEDLLQVSSEIIGRMPADYHHRLGDIMFTLLPAGSVTGAPKPRTVDIIGKIEGNPRGYYTGIFGHFDGIDVDSAVMIRYIENYNNQLRFRSGGGITFKSDAKEEYRELIDKVYVPIV